MVSSLSFLLPVVACVLFFGLASASALSFKGGISHNIFSFKTSGDVLIVALVALSLMLTNAYLFFFKDKQAVKRLKPLLLILSIFNNELMIVSVIPLFVLGKTVSASTVKEVIGNTTNFYLATLVVMAGGISCLVYLLRTYLAKSNWWLFLIALPHIMIGWFLTADYTNFSALIQSDSFSYDKVSKMLVNYKLDLLLFNVSWFKCIAIIILILILMIGLMIYEIIWKKNRNRWSYKQTPKSKKK